MLNTIEIRNFRGFRSLVVESLGRVNLVVGKNNVGKTSFLEALNLLGHQGSPLALYEILKGRRELRPLAHHIAGDQYPSSVSRLFHGGLSTDASPAPIRIGPVGSFDEALSLTYNPDGRGTGSLQEIEQEEVNIQDAQPTLEIRMGPLEVSSLWANLVGNYDYQRHVRLAWLRRARPQSIPPCLFVSSSGLTMGNLAHWWSRIVLTELEDDVLHALRIIEPRVERLTFVEVQASPYQLPIVKLQGANSPIPLRSMGDGMNRVLGIVLALASAKGGYLLVDEIENGVHYSVQPDLWRLILNVATRLDVQVFATSHSWDCIEAFQTASEEVPSQEGYLIRLYQKQGEIQARVFDERKLAIATRQEIEVR